MDTEELKKGWIKWAVLEGLLTGGYYGAETNLPPLLSAFIPAPYQNLGWTGLHALLQLAVFFKVFSPLVRARVEQLYPGIEERSAKLVVFLSVFPMTLFPLLLFFAISKGDEDPAKAPFFIRRPGATMAGFVATLISLVFLGASLETPPIGFEGLQEITYWTLDPTAQYITKLGSDVGKAAAIKETLVGGLDKFEKPESRIELYSTAGFEDPTKVTLFLATETLIVSKLKKAFSEKMKLETGQTKLDELETLPLALNLLEGTTGIMQKSRETTGRMLIFNPISLTGAGAVEAVLLLGVVERMNWQLNRSLRETYQNQIEKFAELARSRPLSPELHARLIALRNRLTMLFPGAKFSGIPTPTAPSPTPSPLPQ